MWSPLLVLSLVIQQNVVSSEQIINENPREVRQSNFAECCPCPDPKRDVYPDQDAANSRTLTVASDDSCPCRPALDSKPASSLLSPALRTFEPYNRPLSSKKEVLKPLLKPEVGLASSVLETLREVTDQEYQEAVARDAARSALRFKESEPLENESRNSMNIILIPNAERTKDIISEASYVQDTGYERPKNELISNNFEKLRSQPALKKLEKILLSPKLTSKITPYKNSFDMDEGASSIKNNFFKPIKSNVLDQMKVRANLLKSKLFPYTNNRLENPIFKDTNQGVTSTDILLEPHNEYSLRNPENIRDPSQIRNVLFNEADPIKLQTLDKHTKATLDNLKDVTIIEPKIKAKDNLLSDNTVRKLKFSDEDLLRNTVCLENVEKPNVLKIYKEDMKDLDVMPSSTKIAEFKNIVHAVDNRDENQNEQSQRSNNVLENTNTDNNNINSNNINSVTKKTSTYDSSYDEKTTERLNEKTMVVDEQNNDSQNIKCTESMNDSDFESSIISNQNVTLPNNNNEILTSSAESINKIENVVNNSEHQINNELLSSSSENKNPISLESLEIPNIRADIIQTLENFKKANEQIQEKLKSNVQNALRVVVEKTGSYDEQQNSRTTPHTKNEKHVNFQDLQNMSDSLLKQSFLKGNEHYLESSTSSNSMEKPFDDFSLLRFSNEKNNSENTKSKSSNQEPNPNSIDIAKTGEIAQILCNNTIMSNNSVSPDMDNENNEMTAQSSNSILNTMPQLRLSPSVMELLSRGTIVQPENIEKSPLGNIKEFFNNYNSINANTFEDDGNRNIKIEHKNFNRGDSTFLNSDSTLNSYKTKVSSPKSLNLKSLLLPSDSTDDVLDSPSQNFPASILRHSSKDNFRTMMQNNNGRNELNPHYKINLPKEFKDKFSSIIPSISEKIRSRSNNVLKSFQESLDARSADKPIKINKNKIFSKTPLNSENLLDAVLKTRKNVNDKFEQFKPDFNRRLTSIFPKLSSEHADARNPNGLTFTKDNAKINNQPFQLKPTTLRNTLSKIQRQLIESSTKNPSLLSLTPNKSTDIKPGKSTPVFRHNTKPKLGSLTHQANSNYNKGSIPSNRKVLPLRENKIIIRPDTIKSSIRSALKKDHLKSRAPNLAKFTRMPGIKPNSESNEPQVLASSDLISKAPYPDLSLKGQKVIQQPYSKEAVPQDMKKNKNILKANQKTLELPKHKNAFSSRSSNGNIKIIQDKNQSTGSNENVDATLSASNNINQSAAVVEPLKENTSYKCKMVCIKDDFDTKDLY